MYIINEREKKYSRERDVKRPISDGIDPLRLLRSRSLHKKKERIYIKKIKNVS